MVGHGLVEILTQHSKEGRCRRWSPQPIARNTSVFARVVWNGLLEKKAPIHQDPDSRLEVAGRKAERVGG